MLSGYPRSHSKSFSLPVIQKEAVILIQTVILKFLRIIACTLEEVKDMLGAQQLLDLLICLPAVTLDGQAGIGIVDIGGNDRDDLIFIIALQKRIIFGFLENETDIHLRPLTKLQQDLYNQQDLV